MKNSEIPALTGLRFVAAFAIVLDHTWPVIFKFDSLAMFNDAIHQLAYVGMTLFFVLSGFIIHYNYSNVIRQPSGLWRFFAARFSRLYPLYLLVLALDFAVYQPPFDSMSWRLLTMTQSWTYQFDGGRFLPYGYHYSVVAWSISTEAFFYVVYPVIGSVLPRMPARVTAVSVTLISGVALWWLSAHAFSFDANGWVSYMSPYSRVFEFASGCALAHAYSRGYRLGRKTAIAAVGWITLFALRGFTGNAALAAFMLHVGLLLPIAALIYAVATSNSFGWLRHKFVLRMGEASYSMYLLHLIVAERLASSIHLADIEPNWVNAIISFTIAVAAIAGLSLASYRTIEVPAQRMLRRLLTGRMHPTIVHGGTGYSR